MWLFWRTCLTLCKLAECLVNIRENYYFVPIFIRIIENRSTFWCLNSTKLRFFRSLDIVSNEPLIKRKEVSWIKLFSRCANFELSNDFWRSKLRFEIVVVSYRLSLLCLQIIDSILKCVPFWWYKWVLSVFSNMLRILQSKRLKLFKASLI